ncbi:MAG: hypothetical protein EG825_03730 [Rhodocyclaceae bacterium]|nr:hypothetical protein [Rhodocyclaceae bacterium]
MRLTSIATCCCIAISLYHAPTFAQQAGQSTTGMQGTGPMAGKRDCAQSRDPQRCEARHKAIEACTGLRGAERQKCREDNMPPPDCSKAANPARCEERQKAREACKGKQGPERRQCMKERMPSKAGTPAVPATPADPAKPASPATPPAQGK